MEQKDYYKILGVDRKASQQEIKAAYRKLAFEHHPDKNRDNPAAAARMKEINESYAVLSDPEKRQRYDGLWQAYGSSAYGHFRERYTEQDIFRGSDIHQIFEEISKAFGFRGFEEIFRETYGPGYRSFEFRRPGAFGRVFIRSTGRGGTYRTGPHLEGVLGKLVKYGLKKKWGIEFPEKGKDLHDVITISRALAMMGGKIRYTSRKNHRELIIRIPPGMRSGQRVRLKGMGESGKGAGEPGDLYVQVRIRSAFAQKIRDALKPLLNALGKQGR